jgi:DNA uptake protein ComE-like DNA-binding protein
MDSRSRWIAIGFLLFLMFVGPFRILALLDGLGLYPSVSQEQVVAELERLRGASPVTCREAKPDWDYVCEYSKASRGNPATRHREGIRTSSYWNRAIQTVVALPVDGPVLNETQAKQWQLAEQQRALRGVNIRTASIEQLRTIPRVDQYRAQEIHAAVRFGLVKQFDDLLKIQGIDRATLNAMRARAYWD